MEVFWPANALCSARDNLFEIYAAVTIADAHYTVSSQAPQTSVRLVCAVWRLLFIATTAAGRELRCALKRAPVAIC